MTLSFNSLGNMGHLGNQMFQYASLKGIATSNKTQFIIPPKDHFGKSYSALSKLDDCFNLNCVRAISNFKQYVEDEFSFNHNLMNGIEEDLDLKGYFQSEKYFKHIKNDIKKDFKFVDSILDECLEIKESFGEQSPIISLHIRRGDYTTCEDYHPTVSLDYCKTALSKLPDVSVIIFSDDPEWCLSQSLFDGDRFMVSHSNTPYFDMCLMTLCDYHIIANSSFSWWGAWLAKSEKVIAPKIWFGPSLSNSITDDLYCENWEVI